MPQWALVSSSNKYCVTPVQSVNITRSNAALKSPLFRIVVLCNMPVSRLAAEAAKVVRVCGARGEAASRRVLGGAEAEAWARVGTALSYL